MPQTLASLAAKTPSRARRRVRGGRVCKRKTASRQNLQLAHRLRHARAAQSRTTPGKNAPCYDGWVSGQTIFAYVDGNPLWAVDPEGLQFLKLTTVEGLRRDTTLDEAVRAGAWTRTVTMPAIGIALSPSAIAFATATATPAVVTTGEMCSAAVGPLQNWVRVGPSYSKALGQKVSLSVRWGASPAKNGKYINQIGNPTLRSANQWLRQQRVPAPGWRAADPGHFHLKP